MPRMVIQKHSKGDEVHYDLMLESPQTLWTWRFADVPGSLSDQPCERIQDHDRRFLEYEGELSPGLGEVAIVEGGTFDLLCTQEDRVHFTARGRKVVGTCRLVCVGENAWVLKCER